MCSDQCYKQDVKGLPSVVFLNDRPLVPVDGWKWSDINDHVSCRPVARRNQRRSVQPPTTISSLEPACLPFVITWATWAPPSEHMLNMSVNIYRMMSDLRKYAVLNGRPTLISWDINLFPLLVANQKLASDIQNSHWISWVQHNLKSYIHCLLCFWEKLNGKLWITFDIFCLCKFEWGDLHKTFPADVN